MLPARRTHQLLLRRHPEGGLQIMTVGALMTGQPGEHEAQHIEQLRPRAEGAADARHARTLPQGERRRHVENLIHLRLLRLRHPPPGVRGKRLQIPARSLRIKDAERQ